MDVRLRYFKYLSRRELKHHQNGKANEKTSILNKGDGRSWREANTRDIADFIINLNYEDLIRNLLSINLRFLLCNFLYFGLKCIQFFIFTVVQEFPGVSHLNPVNAIFTYFRELTNGYFST